LLVQNQANIIINLVFITIIVEQGHIWLLTIWFVAVRQCILPLLGGVLAADHTLVIRCRLCNLNYLISLR